MNDDESIEIVRSDLSHEVATDRAVVRRRLEKPEKIRLKGQVGWKGASAELEAESRPESSQSTALTVLYLGVAACLITGTAALLHAPWVAAVAIGLGATVGLYLLVKFTNCRRPG